MFLDEIGDMPMDAQTRLLRVLQEGEYTMVGGRTAIKSNVRIVAATHRDLSQMIRQGLFREDLYYRLNVVPIRLPPLRERVDDIGDLVAHFLRSGQREGEPLKTIAPDAIKLMQGYSWPGNVRELENLVRRLSALYADESISLEIVQNELNIADRPATNVASGPVDVSTAVESHVAQLLRDHEPNLPPAGLYQRVLDRVEAPLIAMALKRLRRQPDQGGGPARPQPQHPAQEDPGPQHRDRQAIAPAGVRRAFGEGPVDLRARRTPGELCSKGWAIGGSDRATCHILATFALKGGKSRSRSVNHPRRTSVT